jgi:translation elongation factor EF-Tu-like GTPase
MEDKRNLHLEVQEHIDCFGDTDYLREMSTVKNDTDVAQAALKWLALAALHGINANAEEITLKIDQEGPPQVTAEYRKSQLPSPGQNVGQEIVKAIRDITHIEGGKGKMPLALGIRDSNVNLEIKLKTENGRTKVNIEFPEP